MLATQQNAIIVSGRKVRLCCASSTPKHGSALVLAAAIVFAWAVPAEGAEVTLRQEAVPMRFVDYAFAVEVDGAGVVPVGVAGDEGVHEQFGVVAWQG